MESRFETVSTPVVEIAITEDQIRACFPAMKELRPNTLTSAEEFSSRVEHLQRQMGYQLAFLSLPGQSSRPLSVAGFRLGENLACGKYLYVEDLVTLETQRSQGYGSKLLEWLKMYGREHGCKRLMLDSGIQRLDAHRFYERENLRKAGYHFAMQLLG